MRYCTSLLANKGSKHWSKGLLVMVLMVLFDLTDSDVNKDKQQCGDEVVGLTSCLPYVGGEAKAPTMDCCNGLKLVLVKSKVCLCILIKDHNDPKINDTLALGLPDLCHTPYNMSECLSLLQLQPGSPDGQLFTDYEKHNKPKTKTMGLPAGGARNKHMKLSDGGRRMRWLGVEFVGLLLNTLISLKDKL